MARNLRVGVQRGLRQSIGGGLRTGDIFTLSPASFDFSRINTLDSRISFTRASTGTFVSADGLIKTASTNEARFDHDPATGESLGLLLEKAGTNLLLNSSTLSTQTVTVAAATHTLSFYGTGTVTLSGVSTDGPLVGTGSNERVDLTFTPTAGSLILTVSGSVTNAQLERGSFKTSYIPTTSSQVTRAADIAEIAGTNFSSFYNQSEGTIFLENAQTALATIPFAYDFSDGTTENSHRLLYISSANPVPIKVRTKVSNSNTTDISFTAPAIGQFQKLAYGYKLNDFALSVNGASVVSDTNGAVPTVINKLNIGAAFSGGNAFIGHIRRLAYFPTRLVDNTLKSIAT